MTRRSHNDNSDTNPVSLFPFLAVLLCTMGMLVMLLVLMSQGAHKEHLSAREETEPPSQQMDKISLQEESVPREMLLAYLELKKKLNNASLHDLNSMAETAGWFLEELRSIKQRTEEAVKAERDRLAATETAIALRIQEIGHLKSSFALLTEEGKRKESSAERLSTIQRQQERLELLKNQLNELQSRNSSEQKTYAILPYQGKSGTFRQPIYIECTASGIYLMPEGIPFLETDFLLAKYPDNPFDAALRTARNYKVDQSAQGETRTSDPYPLLIVRPGGEDKYYAAVSTLASWQGDFGYEFVENDWEIDYPPTDVLLAKRVEEQLAHARYKLAVPLATMLARIQNNPDLLGSGRGNFSSQSTGGGGSDNNSLQSQLGSSVRLAPVETPFSSSSGSSPSMSSGSSPGSSLGNSPSIPLNSYTSAPLTGPVGANGMNSGYLGYSGDTSLSNGTNTYSPLGAIPPVAGTESNGGWSPSGSSYTQLPQYKGVYAAGKESRNGFTIYDDSMSLGGIATDADFASLQGSPSGLSSPLVAMINDREKATDQQQTSSNTLKNEWETVGNTAYGNNTTGTSSGGNSSPQPDNLPLSSTPFGGGASSTGMPQDTSAGASPVIPVLDKNKELPASKDFKRSDETTGYAASTDGKTAINLNTQLRQPVNTLVERPIRVECHPDKIVFPKQVGIKTAQVISLNKSQADINKELIETVALCVKSWGIAGRNMYWTPWMQVQVYPGGETPFEGVNRVFSPQGISVKREQ